MATPGIAPDHAARLEGLLTRTLLGMGGPAHSLGRLVVSELVAKSMHAGTDIDVSVAWNLGACA